MSTFWKQIALMLIAVLEALLELPPDQDHQPTVKMALAAAKKLGGNGDGHA